eukprot:s1466_g9.t1
MVPSGAHLSERKDDSEMLETVLTRIILRYAQRYICDTLRTDSLSLWGGDLRVQNFELRSDELAKGLC